MQILYNWYYELETDQQEDYTTLLTLINDLLEIDNPFANCYIVFEGENKFDKYFTYEYRYLDRDDVHFALVNNLANCLCIKQLNPTTFTAFYFSTDNEKIITLINICTLNELELVLKAFRLSADRCQDLATQENNALDVLYDKLLATQTILPQYRNFIEQILDDIVSVFNEQPLEKMFYD